MLLLKKISPLLKRFHKHRYANSRLSILWSVIIPVLLIIIIKTIFTSFYTINDALFYLVIISGFFFWQLISPAITRSLHIIRNDRQFFKNLPVEGKIFFPLAWTTEHFLCWLPSLLSVFIIAWIKSPPSFLNLFLLLFYLAVVFIFLTGLVYLLSSLNILMPEIEFISETINLFLLWITPVFYSLKMLPDKFRGILLLNPLTWMVELFRTSLNIKTFDEHILILSISAGLFSIFVLYLGFSFYKKHLNEFVKLL